MYEGCDLYYPEIPAFLHLLLTIPNIYFPQQKPCMMQMDYKKLIEYIHHFVLLLNICLKSLHDITLNHGHAALHFVFLTIREVDLCWLEPNSQ